MSTLYLKIKPSKIWLGLLFIFHSLAFIAVAYTAISFLFKVVLCLFLLGSLIWHAFLSWQDREYIFKANDNEVLVRRIPQVSWRSAYLKDFCYLSPWLVIVYFSIGKWRVCSQFIWIDSIEGDLFKQLKRWLIVMAKEAVKS